MTTVRQTLDYSEGVQLEEIGLRHQGVIVNQAYIVKTLRTPETWTFKALADARKRFDEEVEICTTRLCSNDLGVSDDEYQGCIDAGCPRGF